MLELELPYKHQAGTFSGTQRYAVEPVWESTIDAYFYDAFTGIPTNSAPVDGILCLPTKLLARLAREFATAHHFDSRLR
jgi:hypothetical protein